MISSNNKKVRSLFFRNKDVVAEKKKLVELKKQKRGTISNIDDIVETYNDKCLILLLDEHWLERLPLDSIREFNRFLSGDKHDFGLPALKIQSDLRKAHEEQVDLLLKVDRDIMIGKIDIILAKIDCIQDKLSK